MATTPKIEKSDWSILELVLIAALFVSFYLPFLSIDHDSNGVVEAMNVEAGVRPSPNHILYTAAGRVLFTALRNAGYGGKAIVILQVFNAICGAIAVALAYAAFCELGAPRRAAFAAAALWGTSFIVWYYSTDVSYVTLAGLLTAGALWCSATLMDKPSVRLAAVMGLLAALAILTFQMAVFLLPVLLWPLRRRLREAGAAAVSAMAVIAGAYLVLGASAGHTSLVSLLGWAGGYAGGQLPEWGSFDTGRIGKAAVAAVRSFQWDVFERAMDFLRHPFQPYAIRISAGAVAFAVFAVVTTLLGVLQLGKNSRLIWMIGGYIVCWPFIIWFSPSESFWFFIPNLFLCAAAALAWAPWIRRAIPFLFVMGSVAVMASAIFTSWVLPKHLDPGIVGRKAACIAGMVKPDDTVIATDWTWPAKLEYFHGIRSVQVIDLATSFKRDREKLFGYIEGEVSRTRERQGRVFIIDPQSYNPEHLAWLETQTTFSAADFERFPGPVVFQCEDSEFRQVAAGVTGTQPGRNR